VRQVGGNTGGVDNIVEGELIDERGELQEQGQGLRRVDQYRRITYGGGFIPVQYRRRRQQQLSWCQHTSLKNGRALVNLPALTILTGLINHKVAKLGSLGRESSGSALLIERGSLNRGILNGKGPPYLDMTENSKRTQNKKNTTIRQWQRGEAQEVGKGSGGCRETPGIASGWPVCVWRGRWRGGGALYVVRLARLSRLARLALPIAEELTGDGDGGRGRSRMAQLALPCMCLPCLA
jgi:hypothetical protein